jgi:cytochrome b561
LVAAVAAFSISNACAQPKATPAPATKVAPAAQQKALAPAPAWSVDARNSAIEFSGTHAGAAFKGAFQKWRADIRFDPANLAGSSARVTIETATAKTKDGTQTSTLKSGEWFDAKAHPNAVFQTTSFSALGANRYEAAGTVTIKGKAVPVTMPFTLAITGADATMTAALTLDRVALNMGMKSDPNAEWVSRQIALAIRVRAKRA